MSNPKIRARVAEILAEKAKKKAPKGKAKPKGKPKGKAKAKGPSAAAVAKKQAAEKAKAERAKVAEAKKQERTAAAAARKEASEKAKAERTQAAQAKQTARTAAQQAKQQERAKAVAEKKKAQEQKQRKMAQARKKKKAEPKDDAPSGKEAVAAAMDRWARVREMQKQTRAPARTQAAPTHPPPASNRPTAPTRKAIDMDDMEIKAGARHSRTDIQHLQTIHDSAVACGANCGADDDGDMATDDDAAEKAIKSIMDNPLYYAQHECSEISTACSALQTLCMLIQSELSEEDEDGTHVDQLVDAARLLVKFIASELDEVENAAGDVGTVGNEPMKALDIPHAFGSEIKAVDDDTIGGYAVLFGDATTPDLERDYYTKATNFWLDDFGWPRPITYHHGLDVATRDNPVIGHWTKAAVDDTGVWLTGQLDKAHAYYKAIKELVARGYLKLSSDSAPQWVVRERQSNGANFVKRWPLVTASATVTPMEPRMLPVEIKALLAETGFEVIDDSPEAINPDAARLDGAKAADDERARRLLLELALIELEETAQ